MDRTLSTNSCGFFWYDKLLLFTPCRVFPTASHSFMPMSHCCLCSWCLDGRGTAKSGVETKEIQYRSSLVDHDPLVFSPSVFSPSPGCPYVIRTEEEADARGRNASISGNVLVVRDVKSGRLGNHFLAISLALSLGFCCRSKLVSTVL